jgi:hypothetical protein
LWRRTKRGLKVDGAGAEALARYMVEQRQSMPLAGRG